MNRADSPPSSSAHSSDSSLGKHAYKTSTGDGKPTYRLFPSVEPTPPASPATLQKTTWSRANESRKERSSSVDDTARLAALQEDQRDPNSLAVQPLGRKISHTELKPMSTVPELPLDSPTLPAGFGDLPGLVSGIYQDRASSILSGDCLRDSQALPSGDSTSLGWLNGQDTFDSEWNGGGLGISLPSFAPKAPFNLPPDPYPPRLRPVKQKPSLSIDIKSDDDPPPPPPKSPPRHRCQSSGRDGGAKKDRTPASATTPGSGNLLSATSDHSRASPAPLSASTQDSYFSLTGDARGNDLNSGRREQPARSPRPAVDKPMPNLPPPSSRMSAQVRGELLYIERADGESTPRAPPDESPLPHGKHQPRPSDASQSSSVDSSTKNESESEDDHSAGPYRQSSSGWHNDQRAPTSSSYSRPQSPANLLQSASKGLPSLPPDQGPRSATPDSAFPSLRYKTSTTSISMSDPLQTIQDLSMQAEGLHARYASLRSDRLKLSTQILSSLKEQKPGPEYVNFLLDQHLSLNAINSSMDICFAKLKSLDCKREEAIALLAAKPRTGGDRDGHKKSLSRSLSNAPPRDSGRSTPDESVRFGGRWHPGRSPTPDLSSHPRPAYPDLANDAIPEEDPLSPRSIPPASSSEETDAESAQDEKARKRTTIIRAPENYNIGSEPPLPQPTSDAPPRSPTHYKSVSETGPHSPFPPRNLTPHHHTLSASQVTHPPTYAPPAPPNAHTFKAARILGLSPSGLPNRNPTFDHHHTLSNSKNTLHHPDSPYNHHQPPSAAYPPPAHPRPTSPLPQPPASAPLAAPLRKTPSTPLLRRKLSRQRSRDAWGDSTQHVVDERENTRGREKERSGSGSGVGGIVGLFERKKSLSGAGGWSAGERGRKMSGQSGVSGISAFGKSGGEDDILDYYKGK